MAILQTAQKWRTCLLCFCRLAVLLLFLSQISSKRTCSALSFWTHDIPSKLSQYHPRWQSSWGQHGAHLGPVGPRWAPCWRHEPCYQGCLFMAWLSSLPGHQGKMIGMVWVQHILGSRHVWVHYSLHCFNVSEWYGMQIHIFAPLKQFRALIVELTYCSPGLLLFPWINLPIKVWDEITYPFPNNRWSFGTEK